MFKYGSFRLFLLKLIFGLAIITISLLIFGSLVTYDLNDPGYSKFNDSLDDGNIKNLFGVYGAYLSSFLRFLMGHSSYLISLYLLIVGCKLITGYRDRYKVVRFFLLIFGILLFNFYFGLYNFYGFEKGIVSKLAFDIYNSLLFAETKGGFWYIFVTLLLSLLGLVLILISFSLRLSVFNKLSLILNSYKLLRYFKYINIFRFIFFLFKKTGEKKIKKKNEPILNKKSNFNISNRKNSLTNKKNSNLEIDQFRFVLPNTNLINKANKRMVPYKELERINQQSALKLEKTLAEYGVDGKIVDFKSGPIVTLFEFVPDAGIKSSKIIGLSEDIARAMSSISARISSQPGKSSLGIEIPNSKREEVLFGDLINNHDFLENKNSIKLALGKDISGEVVFTDLEKMPHLLIAGTTGSGKSVGINTMILSILFKFKPNECKLILIDPKMLELSIYAEIPHLLTPVVTDPKKAVFALKWLVREMEDRYKLMSSINVKNITSYNEKVLKTLSTGRKLFREVQTGIDNDTKMPIIEKKEISLEKLPFIVVVIDEMADLMMVAGKEVETLVQRLAQMARASGIHLITATQRPSVDVITGTIKANFPSRISYKVASKFDSRTILNEMGAEQLLGSGDMLFLDNGSNIKRLHGGFVSENEVEKVVSYIKNQSSYDYKKEILLQESNSYDELSSSLVSDNTDELYNKAVEIIIKQQKVSTSFIQRYLQIGYNRAARIVEKMEEDGIITEANNAGKRHVLKKD